MRRNQKGFTLMELMVVIVIVAILAAVAVPLYINYVKDAQRTEAKGAVGAIIAAEQVHLQRYGAYLAYTNDNFENPPPQADQRLDVDVRETLANWGIKVELGGDAADEFTVTAQGVTGRPSANLGVVYHHKRSAPDLNPWTES